MRFNHTFFALLTGKFSSLMNSSFAAMAEKEAHFCRSSARAAVKITEIFAYNTICTNIIRFNESYAADGILTRKKLFFRSSGYFFL